MSVKVAIRVRPFNQRQKFLGCVACVQMKNHTTVVNQIKGKDKKQHYFTFDYSFWSHDQFQEKQNGLLVPIDDTYIDQKKVYAILGQQILQNAWVGFNCCLFAYGQTGAGKSYSMIGYGANKGIIPMACEQLFQRIKRFQKKGERQFQVTISMLQIYNQKVQDLFTSTNKRPINGLKIRQNKALGVYVEGLTKYPVKSYGEIEKKMQQGSKNRSLASTLMNEYSSRAHTIVMLEFIQKEWITNKKMTKKTSLINLVDLAGSERVSKTGVGDNKDRLKEASLINKSLHTLGRVIEALADQCLGKGKAVIAIPYRQSALTRILQNALGGNSKTTMICAISPANDNCEQTLSTLRYADKTKKIKNKPVVNQSEVDKLIRQLRQQNERLKKMLQVQEKISPIKSIGQAQQSDTVKQQSRSNVRASIREIQKEIRKNLQSFAINTEEVIDETDEEQSIMMTEFIDLEDPAIASEFQTSFSSTNSSTTQRVKAQVYITNLNQDELLNFKIKYSCERGLIVTNNSRSKKNNDANKEEQMLLQEEEKPRKVVLCGLGIQDNHARIVKDVNNNGKYFIQAMSQTSKEYTLLNGKPVYNRQQLKHNDRIILGTNSVFLFKNLLNPQQRASKKYTSEKAVGYQYAVNQRQQQLQNESPLLFTSPNRKHRRTATSSPSIHSTPSFDDKDVLSKLQQIQKQFSRMMQQNERKTREKESLYRQKLIQLQREKEMKQKEKMNLQVKLNEKKEETYRLKGKELEIEKLQKRLVQFEQEKKKRKIVRQSMLLDGLDDDAYKDVFDAKDFQDLDDGDSQYTTSTDPNIKPQKRKPNKQSMLRLSLPKQYYDVTLEQFDIKDNQSALGTTNTNSTQMESQLDLINQEEMPQNIMKKPNCNNNNKKSIYVQNNDIHIINEKQELQKYNQIVQSYLDKIKNKIRVFTKLYDITIYSQKLNNKQQPMQQFNCQINGGVHFCRHCKKAINANSKIQHIQYHQNKYEYNQLVDRRRGRIQEGQDDEVLQSEINSKRMMDKKRRYKNKKSKGDLQVPEHNDNNESMLLQQQGHEEETNDNQTANIKTISIKPSDLCDNDQFQSSNSNTSSRKPSQSLGFSDDSLLLNNTNLQIDSKSTTSKNNTRKQSNDHQHQQQQQLSRPQQASTSNIPISKQQKIRKSIEQQQEVSKQKRQIQRSSFAMNFEQEELLIDNDEDKQHKIEQKTVNVKEFKTLMIYPQIVSQISYQQVGYKQEKQQNCISKTQSCSIQIQTDNIIAQNQQQPEIQSLQLDKKITIKDKPSVNSKFLHVDFDFSSMSDIESADNQNSAQQSLNFSSLNNIKQQELTNQIELLKEKIKRLESEDGERKGGVTTNGSDVLTGKEGDYVLEDEESAEKSERSVEKSERAVSRRKMKRFTDKDKIDQQLSQQWQQQGENQYPVTKPRRLSSLPSQFSTKQFLKSRLLASSNSNSQLQKQLESNIVTCNNENIINQRNLSIRKRKRQVQELRKTLIKKQRIELQKQLFILIPMIEKFNLMAKQMNRLIEARVQIEYKNFCHFDIIQALRNYTKAKWKKDSMFSNVQIRIVVANLEQARIYKWAVEVFKNRFEIAEEVFQKYIETDGNQDVVSYNLKDQDRSKDPFWDPLDFIPSGFAYLSIECLLYNIGYDGEISFVFNSRLIAKAYASIVPVKVKRRGVQNTVQGQAASTVQQQQQQQQQQDTQIFNPRNYLQQSLYFTLAIQGLTFLTPQRQNSSPPLRFSVSYELLMNDYKTQIYTTPEVEFKAYEVEHGVNYLRRHCFNDVSESTLAYISDCPLKITLNLLKDYNEQCLNSSFNQDLERSVEDTSSLHDTSLSSIDISKQLDKLQNLSSYSTPDKQSQDFQIKKLDFSKKEKKPLIYENTQLLNKMEKEYREEEKKRKQKRQKLYDKEEQLKGKKDKLKKDDKDCAIY